MGSVGNKAVFTLATLQRSRGARILHICNSHRRGRSAAEIVSGPPHYWNTLCWIQIEYSYIRYTELCEEVCAPKKQRTRKLVTTNSV